MNTGSSASCCATSRKSSTRVPLSRVSLSRYEKGGASTKATFMLFLMGFACVSVSAIALAPALAPAPAYTARLHTRLRVIISTHLIGVMVIPTLIFALNGLTTTQVWLKNELATNTRFATAPMLLSKTRTLAAVDTCKHMRLSLCNN